MVVKCAMRAIVVVLVCAPVASSQGQPPKGWEAIQDGNTASRFTGDPKTRDQCSMEVHRGGLLGLKRDLSHVIAAVSAKATKAPSVARASCGVYINTQDGALLKLETHWDLQGALIRFSALAGGKNSGQQEVRWQEPAPILILVRRKDEFVGLVRKADGKVVTVASLNWPGLTTKATAGVIATNHSTAGAACTFSLTDIWTRAEDYYLNQVGWAKRFSNLEAGEKLIREGMEVFGESESYYLALAGLYQHKPFFEKKVAALRMALAMNPNNAQALNSLGWHFIDNGYNLEEGLALGKKAQSLVPNEAAIMDTVGWGYHKLGQHADARKELERAVAILRAKRRMRAGRIGYFERLGAVCHAMGDVTAEKKLYGEAIALISKTLESAEHKSPNLLADLGWMHLKLDQQKEAREALERAMEEMENYSQYQPGFSEVYERAGDMYVKADLSQQAVAAYGKAAHMAKVFKDGDAKKRILRKMQKALE